MTSADELDEPPDEAKVQFVLFPLSVDVLNELSMVVALTLLLSWTST